jgi:hypothetical protein
MENQTFSEFDDAAAEKGRKSDLPLLGHMERWLRKEELGREDSGCYRCGQCCHGEMAITDRDIRRIEKHTPYKEAEFAEVDIWHGYKVLRMKEHDILQGYYCLFLKLLDDGKAACGIHDFKPVICKHAYCSDALKGKGKLYKLASDLSPLLAII